MIPIALTENVALYSKNVANNICAQRNAQNRFRFSIGACSLFVLVRRKSGQKKVGMRVLGIDPGLRNLGWGIIDVIGTRLSHVANGICHTSGEDGTLAVRLASLHVQLTQVLQEFAPDSAAVEHTFVNKDAVATLKLGQARGIALLVPAQFGLEVGEYAPNAVKKTVVGVGHAAKVQVDHMVRLQLPGVQIAGPDAADALAIAICHAHHLQSAGRLQAALLKAAG
jgi:crossover junction endodeoxyribonuclease RuvC